LHKGRAQSLTRDNFFETRKETFMKCWKLFLATGALGLGLAACNRNPSYDNTPATNEVTPAPQAPTTNTAPTPSAPTDTSSTDTSTTGSLTSGSVGTPTNPSDINANNANAVKPRAGNAPEDKSNNLENDTIKTR
jgi:hypothetical protein